jgi:hypothetical protein
MSVIINKSYTLILILIFLGISNLKSQIIFTSQEEVDSYPSECMNCDIIDQDIFISGPISNFDSLSIIKKVTGQITVISIGSNTDWSGFNNIDTVSGGIGFSFINSTFVLNGFEGLKSCGSLIITECSGLKAITGFNSLNSISSSLRINNCDNFQTSAEFNSLKTVTFIEISDNDTLERIKGFDSLENVDFIRLSSNQNVKSIEIGRSLNIIGEDIIINRNPLLENISGFEVLDSIGGSLGITSNFILSSVTGFEYLRRCGQINFTTNQRLELLPKFNRLIFTDRSILLNNLGIKEISGFDSLKTVGNEFFITGNDSLKIIQGFSSLEESGNFRISENPLCRINGFGKLININGNLYIGLVGIESLQFISTLRNINEVFNINNNKNLVDLTSMSNLRLSSISQLFIVSNNALSICHEKWVCDYIRSGNGEVRIENNAPGCLNEDEVLQACIVDVDEVATESLTIYPNPTSGVLNLTAEVELSIAVVYDYLGRELFRSRIENRQMDLSHLDNGPYLLHLMGENQTSLQVIKFVKH